MNLDMRRVGIDFYIQRASLFQDINIVRCGQYLNGCVDDLGRQEEQSGSRGSTRGNRASPLFVNLVLFILEAINPSSFKTPSQCGSLVPMSGTVDDTAVDSLQVLPVVATSDF